MKTVNIIFYQMSPLYLHILKYFGPISLERVNPSAQRPKGNSRPLHHLPIYRGVGLQTSRVQGAQEERPMVWCPSQTMPTCHGISAPSDRGESRHCSSTGRSADASRGTVEDHQVLQTLLCMRPPCPCALSSCWQQKCLGWVWPLHRATELAAISDHPHPK